MKKVTIARFMTCGAALFAAFGLAACGAESGQGAGDPVGSTSEAITNGQSLQFGGSIKISSTQELWAGGMSATGTLSNVLGIYDKSTDTFSVLKNSTGSADLTLPGSGVVEPEIAAIPGVSNAYLVTGGRSARDGSAVTNSYVLTLNQGGVLKQALISSNIALSTGSVFGFKNVKRCGSSKLVAFGGATTKGFQDLAITPTDAIQVFTYGAGMSNDGSASSWTTLKDGANAVVKLSAARGYSEVLDADATNHLTFYVAGGMDSLNTANTTVDKLTVNSSCVAQNATAGHVLPTLTNGIPGNGRARFASIAVNATVGGVTYDFALGGGNDTGATRPRDMYLFKVSTEAWHTDTNAIQEGKVFPRFLASSTASTVKLVNGLLPKTGDETNNPYYNTSTKVDVYTYSATPAWSSGTSTSERVGAFVDALNGSDVFGFGATHATTTGKTGVNATSTPGNVVAF